MGTVYWITGLSGAGKTTVGTALYDRLRRDNPATVLLDGDNLREMLGGVFGYSSEERRACGMCYARLCKLLADQGQTVVCCTIAMFDSIRDWNRKNLMDYQEVYLRVTMETLRRRDQNGLYSGAEKGRVRNLMGFDLDMEEPKSPDIILDNNGDKTVEDCVKEILLYDLARTSPTSLDQRYWNRYYSRDLAVMDPSLFAQYAAERMRAGESLVDLGCGNGRDSMFFAGRGLRVTAVDRSDWAIRSVNAAGRGKVEGVCLDLTRLNHLGGVYRHCYSRFSIHSLTDAQQALLIKHVYQLLEDGGLFWIEARSIHDDIYGKGEAAGRNAFLYEGHYRRFLVLDELKEALRDGGFTILEAAESKGFAPYRGDDPIVLRVTAKKQRCRHALR